MLRTYDEEYKTTRLIKLGKLAIDPKFVDFGQWVNTKYDVQILNIYTDLINEHTLRLQLIFEYEIELKKFFLKDRFTKSTRIANRIVKKYNELFNPNDSQSILVLFYAFEPLAKEEANTKISLKMIATIKEKYNNVLWEITRFGEHVTFFFYTGVHLKEANESGLTTTLKLEYFETLKHFDEFNYFNLTNFNAVFDSKENFDKHYNSSWRAYYS